MTPEPIDRSYRALVAIPDLGRVVTSMLLARVAQGMVSIGLVLFTLAEFGSPELAGIVTFASVFPGLVLSPVAGALLDRHGRVRLIRFDYLVALATMLLIGGLSIAGLLSPLLLIVIATVSSLTAPFSQTGLRSLFPLMVPEPLWERANALDSNGYVASLVLGPPLAGALVVTFGGQIAIIAIGVPYALAALALLGVREPPSETASSGRLLTDVVDGVRYTFANPTLRGLAASIATLNIAGGIATIVIPILILERLGGSELHVGFVFALSGLAGMAAVFLAGRLDSRGREWQLLVYPMALMAPVTALMLLANADLGVATPVVGIGLIALSQFLIGLLTGPMDIALFTVRQRRTDPAWMGRAFAISMAANYTGVPVGAALAGGLAAASLDLAIAVATAACIAAALFAAFFVPKREPGDEARAVSLHAAGLDASERA